MTKVTVIKAHARRVIDKMTRDEAAAALRAITKDLTMDTPELRAITGGYASQSLQGYVQRYLGAQMGYISKSNAR